MEAIGSIPIFGWIVILIVIILLFILAWFRGISFKKDGEISIEKKLSEYDDRKIHDENLRLEICNKIQEIDRIEHNEEKRLIKNIRIKIRFAIRVKSNCDIAFRSIVDGLTEVINNRILENNLRVHLSKDEREHYLNDIIEEIEDSYLTFTSELQDAFCRQNNSTSNLYPDFSELKSSFQELLEIWADDISKIIINSCKEKIKIYNENKEKFYNDKYRETSIENPIEKNEHYIKLLGGIIM